jgi:hypothetical protein
MRYIKSNITSSRQVVGTRISNDTPMPAESPKILKAEIGIFGNGYGQYLHKDNTTPSWVQLLESRYGILNYCEPESNLFFAVQNFIKNQHKFEKIIFIIPSAKILFLPSESVLATREEYPITYGKHLSQSTIDIEIKTPRFYDPGLKSIRVLQAAQNYFTYIHNNEQEAFIRELMINEVKRIRPDALFLETKTLEQITQKENAHYGINDDSIRKYIDKRNCYLSRENNEILSYNIKNWIKNDSFDMSFEKFVTPAEPFETYFKKLK